MIKHSQQSKGFMPTKSGPNLSGFYMGNSSNLMQMYQTGGQASRGAAMLARSRQRRSDIRKLEEQQRAEAKRQKKGGLFGSIGGLAGGLLGAALAPVTGGASLALASGLGTALGKGLGERFGAGKSVDYDSSGTVYGQQSFRDIDESSEEFNKGILERAGMAGLKAGLTAGFSPGGGIYGTARAKAGGLRSSLADLAGFKGAPLPVAPSVERITDLPSIAGDLVDPSASAKIFDPSSVFSASTYNPMASTTDTLLGASDYVPETFSLTQPTPTFYEDGGLVEYGNGGSVNIKQILEDAGMSASSEQLALFEQFDPTSLNRLAEGLQDSLLSGTQQAQQQQAGTGFAGSGVVQQQQAQQRERATGQLESAQQQAASDFESQTLGQAASFIDQGAEFGSAPPPTVSTLPTADQGDVTFNGTQYVWDSETGRYITMDEYEQSLADQQSDLDYG